MSVDTFGRQHLSFVSELANLIVASDLGDIPLTQVTRVLASKGVAYVRDGDGNDLYRQRIKLDAKLNRLCPRFRARRIRIAGVREFAIIPFENTEGTINDRDYSLAPSVDGGVRSIILSLLLQTANIAL